MLTRSIFSFAVFCLRRQFSLEVTMEDTEFDRSMAECSIPDLTLDQTGETSISGVSEFFVEKVEEVSTQKEVHYVLYEVY